MPAAAKRGGQPLVADLSSLGVLCTAYMEKKGGGLYGQWSRRFLVLTKDSFHWFKRDEGYDLFGEERGHVGLGAIVSVQKLNPTTFELMSSDKRKRQFRALSDSLENSAEDWVNAIRSAQKGSRVQAQQQEQQPQQQQHDQQQQQEQHPSYHRRITLSNLRMGAPGSAASTKAAVVTRLVSLHSLADNNEVVIARSPEWGRVLVVPNMRLGDELIVLLSDGCIGKIGFETLLRHEEEGTGEPFDLVVATDQNAPADSSQDPKALRVSVLGSEDDDTVASDPPYSSPSSHSSSARSRQVSGSSAARSGRSSPLRVPSEGSLLAASGNGTATGATSPASRPAKGSPLLAARAVEGAAWVWNLFLSILSDGTGAVSLVLSLLALLVGLLSVDCVGPETALLFLFYVLLALNSLYQLLRKASLAAAQEEAQGHLFRIQLHAHDFAPPAPDAYAEEGGVEGEAAESGAAATSSSSSGTAGDAAEAAAGAGDGSEDGIPKRFIDGCEGNMAEARRRWDITSQWRTKERVDGILDEPQPHYAKIKEHYPHYNAGWGKAGHSLYWERPGEIDLDPMTKVGIKTDDLCRHWIFVTEFQWKVLCKGSETAKSIAVIDVKGVGISDLVGTKLECVKRCVGYANQHYPERSAVVYFVNASWFFTSVWAIIRPWVHPNTQKKVKIIGTNPQDVLNGLLEHIDRDQIPAYYGGGMVCGDGGKDSARVASVEELLLRARVRELNGQGPAAASGAATSAAAAGTATATVAPAVTPTVTTTTTTTTAAVAATKADAASAGAAKTPLRGGATGEASSGEPVSPLTPWSVGTGATSVSSFGRN